MEPRLFSPVAPSPPFRFPHAVHPCPSVDSGLGDIDPDEPTKKIERFTPLAEYLAENLRELGVNEGRVMIARDIDEMARWMRDGTVDVYFDSAFPSLAVQQQSGSEIILRRWKEGVVEYWSTYLALRSTNVETVEDPCGHGSRLRRAQVHVRVRAARWHPDSAGIRSEGG